MDIKGRSLVRMYNLELANIAEDRKSLRWGRPFMLLYVIVIFNEFSVMVFGVLMELVIIFFMFKL